MVSECSLTRIKWDHCFKTCLSESQTRVTFGSEDIMVTNSIRDTIRANELDNY